MTIKHEKHGKLVVRKNVVTNLEMIVAYITSKELSLIYENLVEMSAVMRFFELETDDELRKTIILESFIKIANNMPLVPIESKVEFHKKRASQLWIPQILKLKVEEGAYLNFICKIDLENPQYGYIVKGPVDPKKK